MLAQPLNLDNNAAVDDREKLAYDNKAVADKSTVFDQVGVACRQDNRQSTNTTFTAMASVSNNVNRVSIDNADANVTTLSVMANQPATQLTILVSQVRNSNKVSTVTTGVKVASLARNKPAVENISNKVTGRAVQSNRPSQDYPTVTFCPKEPDNQRSTNRANVELQMLTSSNKVVSFSGDWEQVQSSADESESTYARISTIATGIAGTTSNTASGELVLSFKNPSDYTGDTVIDGAQLLKFIRSVVFSGNNINNRNYDINYSYKTSGTQFTNFGRDYTEDTESQSDLSANPRTLLSEPSLDSFKDLQVKVTATLISGTGPDSKTELRINSALLTVSSTKEY